VRVISRKKIRDATAKHSEWGTSLNAWYKIAKNAQWRHFEDVKRTWRAVDRVGRCIVFDTANNRCRLIAGVNYGRQKLFIRHILDHAEYGRDKWKNDCHD
jgi:mRNA interferase HigB